MHILILPSEEYIPKDKPLAGIFQHHQAKIIQQNNNQVGVISFSFKHSFYSLFKALLGKKNKFTINLNFSTVLHLFFKKIVNPISSSFSNQIIEGINVMRCDGYWGFKKSNLPLSKYEMWIKYGDFAFNHYIKKYGKPDVIHAHNMIYAGLLAVYLNKKHNIPIVVTEHSSQYAMGKIPNQLVLKLNNAFESNFPLFAVSPKLIELLENKFKVLANKVQWLPNVLDPFIENYPYKEKLKSSKFRFLNIGNLIPLKGQKELINAFAKAFKNKLDTVELVIAGSGELKKQLQEQIETLNLANHVKLVGLLSREEVVNQIDKTDAFVLPSHYETFGVVLIEALSRGVPVISTTCGGPECVIYKENGILVPPKNEDELAVALSDVFQKRENFDSAMLRQECLFNYGSASFYEKLRSIYQKKRSCNN
ncbi:MAG: glycosyltransferase [Flavobacteriales bacterium]|nr:glycosyltransferase [Flavobacteriales bacterium]MCB9365483.1 glycosyltransferase [Flavobacteriales bacterium]